MGEEGNRHLAQGLNLADFGYILYVLLKQIVKVGLEPILPVGCGQFPSLGIAARECKAQDVALVESREVAPLKSAPERDIEEVRPVPVYLGERELAQTNDAQASGQRILDHLGKANVCAPGEKVLPL